MLCSCRLHWQTSGGSANILMLKEHFVWFCIRPHLTGLLTYLTSFPNIMLWKQTNFVSLQYITSFWIWNCFSANWKGKYETWFSCDILESLNQKKLGLIGRGGGFESRKDWHSVLASGFFFSQLFSLFIFAYVTAIYESQFHLVLNRTQLERNDRRLWRNVCRTETTD